MNKIILNIGLLVFFLSLIVFSRQNMLAEEILLKSFIIFFLVTLMLSIITLFLIRAINKASAEKQKNFFS